MKKLPPIFLALLVLFASCYTQKPISSVMNSWIGTSEHDVIMRMGSPTSTASDGADGKIIRYEQSHSTTTYNENPYYRNKYDASVIANTYNNTMYKEFFINKDGKVYNWRTNYPGPKELDTKATTITVVVLIGVLVIFMAALFSSDPTP